MPIKLDIELFMGQCSFEQKRNPFDFRKFHSSRNGILEVKRENPFTAMGEGA